MAECWFQGKTQESSVGEFFAAPSPAVQRMGQDRMQNTMRLGMVCSPLFLYSGHILTRTYVRVVCWAIFCAYKSHGNLEKLCPCQNIISYWLITHSSEKSRGGTERGETTAKLAVWFLEHLFWSRVVPANVQAGCWVQALIWGSGQYKNTNQCTVLHWALGKGRGIIKTLNCLSSFSYSAHIQPFSLKEEFHR